MHFADTAVHLKIRLVDLLGDPPVFQHVEPAHFHLGGSLCGANEEKL